MEQLVLGVLEFNVTVPTAFFFANHFSKVGTYIKSYLYESKMISLLVLFVYKIVNLRFSSKDGGLNGQNFIFG